MNVCALLGSPRVGGNSDLLLQSALKGIDEGSHAVRFFRLNDMAIRPCQNCGECDATGVCGIDDDMTAIYGAIRWAERIILASPVYFFGLSAQTKIMIDRCQPFWCEKYLLKRPVTAGPRGRKGLLLLVGGMKKEIGIQCGEATARAFFRTVNVPEHNTLSFLGVDHLGAIREHATALSDSLEAGRSLVVEDNSL